MKDTHAPVRKAFYELLNNQLSYDSSPVPVSDKQTKKIDENNYYVILDSQTSTPDDTKSSSDEETTITLDIITKTDNSVTSDIADDIAGQIFTLLFSTLHVHNLPSQSGFQFLNLKKINDFYLPLQITSTEHMFRRIIQFGLRVVY